MEVGTGLGLAHVHRVVEQFNGHLDVESASGEGTTFTLRWPISGPPPIGEHPSIPGDLRQ